MPSVLTTWGISTDLPLLLAGENRQCDIGMFKRTMEMALIIVILLIIALCILGR
ncbi:hypothetical protein GTN42_03945 [bacterium]|nr:hypothetical protein [bacterium]